MTRATRRQHEARIKGTASGTTNRGTPFWFKTRWNDCSLHGHMCSHSAEYCKEQRLKRRKHLEQPPE